MKVASILFIGPPIHHEFPSIYENLGLPDVSSFVEQGLEFSYTIGKVERVGYGSIRLYKQHKVNKIIFPKKLPGLGPKRLKELKKLILDQIEMDFLKNIESDTEKRRVYYNDFSRTFK